MAESDISAPKPTPQATRHPFGQWFWRHGWFWLFTWVLTLAVGRQFFGSLHDQLFLSDAAHHRIGPPALFSAPLDDVFIHFDFARSTARGFPFQWSEGNGYSSGGTSMLYPLVLSVGYRIGYRGLMMMHWAGIVACVCVWFALLLTRRMLRGFYAATHVVLPLWLLSVGGLNWALFSGMEVALFISIWAASYATWDTLIRRATREPSGGSDAPPPPLYGLAAWLGFALGALVATRPESVILVPWFALSACVLSRKGRSRRELTMALSLMAVPAAAVLAAHLGANRYFTGEWSAAGSIAKLELNAPYMSRYEVWKAWLFHLEYQLARITHHHFTSSFTEFTSPVLGKVVLSSGLVVWGLAVAGLFDRRIRRTSLLLWVSVISFGMMVALNGQVRWQNERYTMPVVAWLLLLAGLGMASLADRAWREVKRSFGTARRLRHGPVWWALAAAAGTALFLLQQASQYRDQVWFFGRASRNILDQQITAGVRLRSLQGSRVLVGDAGAIPYVSDLPALDLIGLGGYHDLPFARATRLGVAGGIELLQRMPADERPDLMAIYPNWWGLFPVWFGERLQSFPVVGNVICGGPEKVVYRANFESLDGGDTPYSLGRHEKVRAEVDFADIVSERAANVHFEGAPGFVSMRLLPNPLDPARDLWDGGRIVPQGTHVALTAKALIPHEEARLIVRLVPAQPLTLIVTLRDGATFPLRVAKANGWQDVALKIPREYVRESFEINIRAEDDEAVLYHLWLVQEK